MRLVHFNTPPVRPNKVHHHLAQTVQTSFSLSADSPHKQLYRDASWVWQPRLIRVGTLSAIIAAALLPSHLYVHVHTSTHLSSMSSVEALMNGLKLGLTLMSLSCLFSYNTHVVAVQPLHYTCCHSVHWLDIHSCPLQYYSRA